MLYTVTNQTRGEDFGVHRAGCRDIGRDILNGQWDADADSVAQLIASEREDLAEDFGDEAALFTFKVFGCAR
jgi:hypothetical protein